MILDKIAVINCNFDPLKSYDIDIFKLIKTKGYKLMVIVNNDYQVKLISNKLISSLEKRIKILQELKCVDFVRESIDNNNTICKTLQEVFPKPNYYYYKLNQLNNTNKEKLIYNKLGIKLIKYNNLTRKNIITNNNISNNINYNYLNYFKNNLNKDLLYTLPNLENNLYENEYIIGIIGFYTKNKVNNSIKYTINFIKTISNKLNFREYVYYKFKYIINEKINNKNLNQNQIKFISNFCRNNIKGETNNLEYIYNKLQNVEEKIDNLKINNQHLKNKIKKIKQNLNINNMDYINNLNLKVLLINYIKYKKIFIKEFNHDLLKINQLDNNNFFMLKTDKNLLLVKTLYNLYEKFFNNLLNIFD